MNIISERVPISDLQTWLHMIYMIWWIRVFVGESQDNIEKKGQADNRKRMKKSGSQCKYAWDF